MSDPELVWTLCVVLASNIVVLAVAFYRRGSISAEVKHRRRTGQVTADKAVRRGLEKRHKGRHTWGSLVDITMPIDPGRRAKLWHGYWLRSCPWGECRNAATLTISGDYVC